MEAEKAALGRQVLFRGEKAGRFAALRPPFTGPAAPDTSRRLLRGGPGRRRDRSNNHSSAARLSFRPRPPFPLSAGSPAPPPAGSRQGDGSPEGSSSLPGSDFE